MCTQKSPIALTLWNTTALEQVPVHTNTLKRALKTHQKEPCVPQKSPTALTLWNTIPLEPRHPYTQIYSKEP